mmetsp:Transcript_10706/g.40073  ORF Transcript_10706/g.40073 Transcript_10706/m.40073 type:complete len:94 (-) Transcript_10706:9196-9477(-)
MGRKWAMAPARHFSTFNLSIRGTSLGIVLGLGHSTSVPCLLVSHSPLPPQYFHHHRPRLSPDFHLAFENSPKRDPLGTLPSKTLSLRKITATQ